MNKRGVPTTQELADALEAFLRAEVVPSTDRRLSFMARVAANVAAIIRRELDLGPAYAAAHRARLESLGVRDDAELCAAIRDGGFDERWNEVVRLARADSVDKLRIANPRWLVPEDAS
jgi:hypothetical protein